MKSRTTQLSTTALCGMMALALAQSARANNLVLNGNFEDLLVAGVASEFGSLYPSQQVKNWSTGGYNFVFTPGSADTTGAFNQYTGLTVPGLTLWGPGANGGGVANGLPASSPSGGNYIAADGAYLQDGIRQTINGLTVGKTYNLSFYWAGAQQHGFDGANTEQWQVKLGSDTQLTSVYNNPSHGFSGWQAETFSYTASSASEVLEFFAIGTPNGVPPFSLLDGVSLTESSVPDGGTTAVLFGLAASAILVAPRLRRKA